jgi:type I restriction enzyme, S subunit
MNASQLLKHFDRLAEAPDAVARLRRFILDLAVRGKLVEQDAGDEPAGELLKKIRTEQARLVKLGKIKKANALEPLAAGDEPFDLPRNWTWCWLGDIGDWGSGSTPPRGNSEYYGDDITWLKSGELGDSLALKGSSERVTHLALNKCSFRLNQPGDVLIAMYGATIGKLAILAEEAVTNQAVCGCTPIKGILNRYLFLFLQSRRADFHAQSEGGAQPNISKVKILTSAFALPPLAEQHRIVAKVDELMALCDQLEAAQQERERRRNRLAAASLQRLNQPAADATPEEQREHARFHLNHLPRLITRPEQVKQMRQLLVNLSVFGKLDKSAKNDESAEVLLDKIWSEKKSRKLLKSTQKNREKDVDLALSSLPKGWVWTTFESFATEIATGPFGSALHQSDYIDGGIPLVNPSHMIDGRIVANPKISVSEETANGLASYRMKSGDVVMARRGEVGRAAIVTDAEVGWLCGTGSFFVSFHKEINRQYVILLLRSDAVRSYLAGKAVGTTMVNLNHGILKRIPIALPPAAEQHRIVAKVDELMALCDKLEAQLTITQIDSRRLLEAVLA